MNTIPTHRISDVFDGRNAFLLRISDGDVYSAGDAYEKEHTRAKYAHRDDYFIFFLVKDGSERVTIDFEEYEFGANSLHCIMPGQVHYPASYIDAKGWFLAVDSLLVKSEYREIFEKKSLIKKDIKIDKQEFKELEACLTIIEQRMERHDQPIDRNILSELISAYIGMVAQIYQKGVPTSLNKRAAEITLQFKSLLSENYYAMKRPAQYAQHLNLSLVYLNEVVKKTTGL